ncbi:MAG: hypothetical protein ACLTW9_10040 [Enterocloster sp.]
MDYDFSGKRVLLAEDNHDQYRGGGHACWRARALWWIRRRTGCRAMEMFSKSPEGYYDAISDGYTDAPDGRT